MAHPPRPRPLNLRVRAALLLDALSACPKEAAVPKPYDRTTYDGKTVDWITRAALEDTAKRLGYDLTITQGSYNAGGVNASAGTHDGGGVGRPGAVGLGEQGARAPAHRVRRVVPPAIPGVWPDHIHAVLIGNAKLSPAAKAQVLDYLAGRNGLADHGPDDGPRQFVANRFRWEQGAGRIKRAAALVERAQLLLSTGIRGYAVGKSRKALRDAAAEMPEPK
jgi:hypothetical protein